LVASVLSGQGQNYLGCIMDPSDSFKGIANILLSFVNEKEMRNILKRDMTIISVETEEEKRTSQKSKYGYFSLFFLFSFFFFFPFFNFILRKRKAVGGLQLVSTKKRKVDTEKGKKILEGKEKKKKEIEKEKEKEKKKKEKEKEIEKKKEKKEENEEEDEEEDEEKQTPNKESQSGSASSF